MQLDRRRRDIVIVSGEIVGEIHEVWAGPQYSGDLGYTHIFDVKDGQFLHRKVDLERGDVGYLSFTKQRGVPDDNGVRRWLGVSGRNREPLKTRKGTRVELALRGWWENKVDVLPLETVGFYDINEHLSSRFVPTLEVNGEQVVPCTQEPLF
jgi:hypothetical protein